MADLLGLGSQSVLTAQKNLNTTSHNISNVNTEGFSRQSVVQGTNDPFFTAGQTYGMGVHVENVRRSWDQFAVDELHTTVTNVGRSEETVSNLNMVTDLLSSSTSRKIPETVNEWFDAVKTLAIAPNSLGARKVVLEKANTLAQNLNEFDATVQKQESTVNDKLQVAVEQINSIGEEIKDIHKLLIKTPGPHNDLLDKHADLIKELSQYTKVSVTPCEGKQGFNVLIGNGDALVTGVETTKLSLVDGDPDPQKKQLALVNKNGLKAISRNDINGKLESLFDLRDKLIPGVRDEMGKLAIALSEQVNHLQHQGLNLRGEIGEAIFTEINTDKAIKERATISGHSTADVAVVIEDLTELKSGEYTLKFDGTKYSIKKPNGQVQDIVMQPGNYFKLDGFKTEIHSPLSAGETVIIRPTRQGAANIKVQTLEPEALATQSFINSHTESRGDAKIHVTGISKRFGRLTAENLGPMKKIEVEITPDGQNFTVKNANGQHLIPAQPYPPLDSVKVGGLEFELTEGALPGDKISLSLDASEGENSNLIKLQSLQTNKVLSDGKQSLIDVYADLNVDMGIKSANAERLYDISKLENETAEERVSSVSGVNLDEEAANMMKFQQAYMASSKIIEAANTTFEAILKLR